MIGRGRRGRGALAPGTHSLVLCVDAALASALQRGAALVVDALVYCNRLAAKAAGRAAEAAAIENPEPRSSRRSSHRRRHFYSASVPHRPAHLRAHARKARP